jgi:hypothetical protein
VEISIKKPGMNQYITIPSEGVAYA